MLELGCNHLSLALLQQPQLHLDVVHLDDALLYLADDERQGHILLLLSHHRAKGRTSGG